MKRIGIIFTGVLMSCANIVPPTGGANDTTPPQIVEVRPKNKSTNVKNKEIVFEFDEFVNLNDPQNTLEIYPMIKKKEKIIGKKLHITFEEPLRDNTTYIVSFTDAIKDFREGNSMANELYTFSTGPILDSGKIEGVVVSAEMKNALKDIVCVVAENRDSFLKEKYLMKAITNENGIFLLKGLKEEKKYSIFCFRDINKDKKWSKDEEIGFAKEAFTTTQRPEILFNEISSQQKLIKVDNSIPGVLSFVFETTPEKAEITFDTLKTKIVGFEKKNKTIKVYYDTTSALKEKIIIKANELREEEKQVKLIAEIGYQKRKPFIKKEGREAEQNHEENKPLELEWSYPIQYVDTAKIILIQDKMQEKEISFKQSKMLIKSTFMLGKKYTLILLDSAVQNSFNQYSKGDTTTLTITPKRLPSNITITLTDLDEKKAYILFNKETKEKKKQTYPFTGKKHITITQKNLLPEEYTYFLIEDENKNGRWDKGDFEQNILPEKVYMVLKQKLDGRMDFVKSISLNKIKK